MYINEQPMDLGNANVIIYKTVREKLLHMERTKKLFDFPSKEPEAITIKRNETSKKELFVRIIRVRAWHEKHKIFSWNIYSKERETYSDLIIRRVIWDLNKDAKLLKKYQSNQTVLSEQWPSAEICNTYISMYESPNIIHKINNLDSEVEKGFVLNKNNNRSKEWHSLELLRLYDWGQIHFTWCLDNENEAVENKIKELVLELDLAIKKVDKNIFEMTLNYYEGDPKEYSSENLLNLWEENNVKK